MSSKKKESSLRISLRFNAHDTHQLLAFAHLQTLSKNKTQFVSDAIVFYLKNEGVIPKETKQIKRKDKKVTTPKKESFLNQSKENSLLTEKLTAPTIDPEHALFETASTQPFTPIPPEKEEENRKILAGLEMFYKK